MFIVPFFIISQNWKLPIKNRLDKWWYSNIMAFYQAMQMSKLLLCNNVDESLIREYNLHKVWSQTENESDPAIPLLGIYLGIYLLCLWDFSAKNTGVGCHCLLQGSSWCRDQTPVSWVSCTAGGLFTSEPFGKPQQLKKKKRMK